MFLFIYGDQGTGCEELSEALVGYYSYRGTAAFSHNYLAPLESMAESAMLAARSEGVGLSYYHDHLLIPVLYEEFKFDLLPAALRRVTDVTGRWERIHQNYVAIIYNARMPELAAPVGMIPTYRVLLTCKDNEILRCDRVTSKGGVVYSKGHPLGRSIFDCAESDIFDQVIDTNDVSFEKVAELVGESIHRKMRSAFIKPNENDNTEPGSL